MLSAIYVKILSICPKNRLTDNCYYLNTLNKIFHFNVGTVFLLAAELESFNQKCHNTHITILFQLSDFVRNRIEIQKL